MKVKTFILTLMLVIALAISPTFAQEGDPRDRTLTVDNFSVTFHRAIAPATVEAA